MHPSSPPRRMMRHSSLYGRIILSLAFTVLTASCATNAPPPPALNGVLPAQIGGVTLEIKTFAGTQIADPKSTPWADLLARIGASATDLSLEISVPAQNATSDFQIGAFRIAKTDWATRLSAFVQNANAAGNVSFTQVPLGGKTVYRGQSKASATGAKGYYYVAGDTLFFITASNETEVAEAFSKITAPASGSSLRASPLLLARAGVRVKPTDLPPPTGILIISPLELPITPFCVAENLNPNNRFLFLLTDGNGIPANFGATLMNAPFGYTFPTGATGSMVYFYYRPITWAGDDGQTITLSARTTVSSDQATLTIHPPQIQVHQCLRSAFWKDGDRVVQIDQKGASFTAKQASGTQTCGSPGLSFSGTFTSDGVVAQVSGADLVVCNPPPCVSAGFLPKTVFASYQGVLFADGKRLDITWDDPNYTLQYDPQGALTACDQTSTSQGTFSLTRPFSEFWQP